jgi:hypothetical protein
VAVTDEWRARASANDCLPVGPPRFIATTCGIEYRQKAEADSWSAVKRALWGFDFDEIMAAHAASGRYPTCLCS